MTYLELMEMREKYNDNAMTFVFSIICFLIVIMMVTLLFTFSHPFFATKFILMMFIIALTPLAPITLCAIKMYLYLTGEMKEAWEKEMGMRD